MKKLAIIGNPKAGNCDYHHWVNRGKLFIWGWPCDFFFPSTAAQLTEACAKLDPATYEAVVVIGGDGTLNHAIRGLMKANPEDQVPLYVFPSGTANDLASELGTTADWAQVQRLIHSKQMETIDLVEVNGHPFVTVAGIGLGASLTEEFNQRRATSKTFRFLHETFQKKIYTTLSVRAIFQNWGRERNIQVESGIFNERIKTSAIFVCNQERLGGDLVVAREKVNVDQRLKVLIIPRTCGIPMLRALKSLKDGEIPDDFISFYTKNLRLTDLTGENISVFGDGEILTKSPSLKFQSLPSRLRVYSHRPILPLPKSHLERLKIIPSRRPEASL